MGRKYRKYSYNQTGKNKKVILIAVAVALVLLCGLAVLFLSNGDDQPKNIATLKSLPTKTTYYVGDSPSWDGLELSVTFTEADISMTFGPDECTITGFDSSKPAENQVITVKFADCSATFTVTILEKEQPKPQKFLLGITLKTSPKTEYKVGEALDVTGGMLNRHYSDDSVLELAMTAEMVSGFDSSKAGTYTLTITYTEDNYPIELTYDITVTD